MKSHFTIAMVAVCSAGLSFRTAQAAGACCAPEGPVAVPAADGGTNATANPRDGINAGQWRDGDVFAYHASEWVLEIKYLNRGTRSEGQEGQLRKGGTPVAADAIGQTQETPIGLLRYYGSERRKPWDLTGWNFADRRKVRRSAELPPHPAAAPSAATP
jgi:hypothetical protein